MSFIGSTRRGLVGGLALTLLTLGGAFLGPVVAAEPTRVIFTLDGLSAGTTVVHWERIGDFDRATVGILNFGRQRATYFGERADRRDVVSLNVLTYWLPVDRSSDDEVAAIVDEGGVIETGGRVAIDHVRLSEAALSTTDVVLDLIGCSPLPGYEALCEGLPSQRTISVAARFSAVGELLTNRSRSREVFGHCDLLSIGSDRSRDAEATVWLDGTPYTEFVPWLTYIADGKTFVRMLCNS